MHGTYIANADYSAFVIFDEPKFEVYLTSLYPSFGNWRISGKRLCQSRVITTPKLDGMDHERQDESRASDTLSIGYPFCAFPFYDAQDLPPQVLDWLEAKLEEGRPLLLRGFNKLSDWDASLLNKNSLFELLSMKCKLRSM